MNAKIKTAVLGSLLVAFGAVNGASANMHNQSAASLVVETERTELFIASDDKLQANGTGVGKTSNKPDLFPNFSNLLRTGLGDLLAPGAHTFIDMVADDIVMEFPYAPSKGVGRLKGKAALEEYLPHAATLITIEQMSVPVVHRTQNPNIVILEFTGKGYGTQTGIAYDQTYISVVTLADGYITHYRDYWNPLVVLRAIGGEQAIKAEIKEAENAR